MCLGSSVTPPLNDRTRSMSSATDTVRSHSINDAHTRSLHSARERVEIQAYCSYSSRLGLARAIGIEEKSRSTDAERASVSVPSRRRIEAPWLDDHAREGGSDEISRACRQREDRFSSVRNEKSEWQRSCHCPSRLGSRLTRKSSMTRTAITASSIAIASAGLWLTPSLQRRNSITIGHSVTIA